MDYQLVATAFQQLSSICAVLGGLAFTASTAIMAVSAASNDSGVLVKSAKITVIFSLASSVFFVISALLWSFMSADMLRALAEQKPHLLITINGYNWIPSISMIIGSVAFFGGIGASGWISSYRVGVFSSALALMAFASFIFMLKLFSDL